MFEIFHKDYLDVRQLKYKFHLKEIEMINMERSL